MSKQLYLSVIIPIYNEEETILDLRNKLNDVLSPMGERYEIIFVDDGSTDKSFERLNKIKDDNVRIIQFQRNFGKSAALSCGFAAAKGEYLITMDGDLQDDPKEIPRFLDELTKYDMVSGWKFERHDPISKTIPSKFFNKLSRVLTDVHIHDFNCGFKGYRNCVVKNIKVYGELHRYIPALAYWRGYSVSEIKVEHHPRAHGTSKYGIERLLKGFLDLISVTFLVVYKKRPLHVFGSIGLLMGCSGVFICFYLLSLWFRGIKIGDRPLLMLGILLLIMSIQFISIGLIGELITNSRNNDDYIIKYDSYEPEKNH
ncbi:Glycosyltransferase [Methanosarcina siciliae C2J]|uniref:Glycosyltransferase n=1 Tax=Methanosarcina siciliae C2J TaxID=1434118 RepID=A0A0E3PLV3_9EURY|nr:glycosyltransferase family 2 protein [Methanosarcina siciliae]AKB35857.1 Glycosyltransferase [Methanosarcina siciliae C2J]